MIKKKLSKFEYFFAIYLIFICVCSFYFMRTTYLNEANNSVAEWIINYQGGFIRRGLAGEIFAKISLFFEVPLRDIILYFLYAIFIIYYLSIFVFFRNFKNNYLIIFAILSPLFLIWPIAEREALGRKDILILTSFIIFCSFFKYINLRNFYLLFILIYTPIILIHEIAIFYLPFFFVVIFFKISKVSIKELIPVFLISIFFLLLTFILFNSIHSPASLQVMCEKIENIYNDKCGLGAKFLDKKLNIYLAELGLEIEHIIRNLIIFFIGYFALILLILNSHLNKLQTNFITSIINFKLLSAILFLPTLIPFFIAVDWGRWFNLSYSMILIFYIFCLKNNYVFLKIENKNLNYFFNLFEKSKFSFFIALIILCFSWNPKAVYHEDIGSVPIYRIITKIYNHW